MSTGNPKGPLEDIGRKIDQHFGSALTDAEAELKRVIAYLNDEVVPQVRQNSGQAMRIAAENLHKLADKLDRRGGSR